MSNSNIVAGSNVYMSRTDNPYWDPEFVAQVEDYELIKYISSRRQVDSRIAPFLGKQGAILKAEMRCIYAKNDPCWGYSNKYNRIVSACINDKCHRINVCNPNYCAEDAKYWTTSEEESLLYGNPEKLSRYYLVDMISDEEMTRYDNKPVYEGLEYSVPKNPVLEDKQDDDQPIRKTKIDPITGRKMVVIGYKWMITDNASYESEELVEIWGFVDDVEEKNQVVRKKAKRIKKKKTENTVKKKFMIEEEKEEKSDYVNKELYEKTVVDNISAEIKLIDLNEDSFGNLDIIILLDNPAELAFVSGTLLLNNISHGIISKEKITLALIDDFAYFSNYNNILISSTVMKHGCKRINIDSWKALAQKRDIEQLIIGNRDYYAFVYGNESRWTCRNMYGVTHVCILPNDIRDLNKPLDGIYPVSLVDSDDSYLILDQDGDVAGYLGKSFVDLIDALKEDEEIPGRPAVIKGISLKVVDGKLDILGMGHLKFQEY